jgi:hypothetical protein
MCARWGRGFPGISQWHSGGEVLLGLLALARVPVELAEAEVAVGNEGAHFEVLGERERIPVVATSALWGITAGGDLTEDTSSPGGRVSTRTRRGGRGGHAAAWPPAAIRRDPATPEESRGHWAWHGIRRAQTRPENHNPLAFARLSNPGDHQLQEETEHAQVRDAGSGDIGGAAPAALAGDKVAIDQVPAVVRATIERETRGGRVHEIERETKRGVRVYEVGFIRDNKKYEMYVSEDGTVLKHKPD